MRSLKFENMALNQYLKTLKLSKCFYSFISIAPFLFYFNLNCRTEKTTTSCLYSIFRVLFSFAEPIYVYWFSLQSKQELVTSPGIIPRADQLRRDVLKTATDEDQHLDSDYYANFHVYYYFVPNFMSNTVQLTTCCTVNNL